MRALLLLLAWIAFVNRPSPSLWAEAASLSESDMDLLVNLPEDQVLQIAKRVLGVGGDNGGGGGGGGGQVSIGNDAPMAFTKAALLSLWIPDQQNMLLSALAEFKADGQASDAARVLSEQRPGLEQEGGQVKTGEEMKEEADSEAGGIGVERYEEDMIQIREGTCHGAARRDFRVCGCKDDTWETDYYFDLLSLRHTQRRCPASCNLQEPANVLVAALHIEKNVSYWHSKVDQLSKPLVLFHSSDDECKTDLDALREIYQRFKLVIRQYACRELLGDLYEELGNVLVMPLGYGANYTGGQPAVNVIEAIAMTRGHERRYKWSFQGTVKRNRQYGIGVFADMRPNFPGAPSHVGKWELFKIYHESTFVLSGYGDSSIDCFRHYEATIAGAIPIVVSPMPVIIDAFTSFRDGVLPPWIISETWEDARELADDLLRGETTSIQPLIHFPCTVRIMGFPLTFSPCWPDPARLEEVRLQNLFWMRSEMERGKDAVDRVARSEWHQTCG